MPAGIRTKTATAVATHSCSGLELNALAMAPSRPVTARTRHVIAPTPHQR